MKFDENFENEDDVAVDFELPPKYKVILLNDDFTTKEFVVYVLMSVFHKSVNEAEQIMESVHNAGSGIAGVYSYDIAATRVQMATTKARQNGFPLKLKMEKE